MNKDRKKRLSLPVMVVCILSLLVFGCAQKGTPVKEAPKSGSAVSAPEQKKVFEWKLQSAFPPPEKLMDQWTGYGQASEVARKVEERTKGGLKIKVYPPDALFKVLETGDALRKGSVEMALSSGSYMPSTIPEAIFFETGLPYGLKSFEDALKLYYETDYLKILRQAYAQKNNTYLLSVNCVASYTYITKFPIHQLADLKGKKIRAVGVGGQIAAAHGAVPVNISGAEQYMALQRGTVDGTIYPPYAGISYKFFEVAKYISWPPVQQVMGICLVVNQDAWNSLPKEYQNILQEEAEKMSRHTYQVSGPALNKIAVEEGKKQFGAESIWLSDEEFAKFQKAVVPLWEEWGKKSEYCAQLLGIAKKFAEK